MPEVFGLSFLHVSWVWISYQHLSYVSPGVHEEKLKRMDSEELAVNSFDFTQRLFAHYGLFNDVPGPTAFDEAVS